MVEGFEDDDLAILLQVANLKSVRPSASGRGPSVRLRLEDRELEHIGPAVPYTADRVFFCRFLQILDPITHMRTRSS